MADRPFRVLGLQQVAVGGLDRRALHELWVNKLGLEPGYEFHNELENVDGEIAYAGFGSGRVDFNLLEPIEPDRSPRAHRPALNHVGLWVDDLEAAVEWLQSEGVDFTARGIRRGAAGHDVTFIDPRAGGQGVLIELIQAPPALLAAADSHRSAADGE